MTSPRRTLRLPFLLLLLVTSVPRIAVAAEPAPATQTVPTVVIDDKKLLSAQDLKDVVAVAETYIEGDEQVYTVEVLGKDLVRIKLGTLKRPGNAYHGILFMLRRTPKGWHQNQKDPASVWVE